MFTGSVLGTWENLNKLKDISIWEPRAGQIHTSLQNCDCLQFIVGFLEREFGNIWIFGLQLVMYHVVSLERQTYFQGKGVMHATSQVSLSQDNIQVYFQFFQFLHVQLVGPIFQMLISFSLVLFVFLTILLYRPRVLGQHFILRFFNEILLHGHSCTLCPKLQLFAGPGRGHVGSLSPKFVLESLILLMKFCYILKKIKLFSTSFPYIFFFITLHTAQEVRMLYINFPIVQGINT